LANKTQPKIIELAEYESRQLTRDEIDLDVGEQLWRNYGAQVAVDFPSPKTGDQWLLTAQGWVGYIPVSKELGIALRPKIHLSNLFRMLEYAYRLESFKFLDDLFESKSLEEFYERLANVLARRIVDRSRKGLYRTYLARTERLPFVRGRLNVRQLIRAPWDVKLQSHYHEHTGDIEDNQILAWTLYVIAHSGLLTERVLPTVRRAYRALQGSVTLKPFGPKACTGRLYNRLNEDYRPLHALCRFFLEHSGPSHEMGGHTMLPFLVDTARLYERFVAEWLKVNLPRMEITPPRELYLVAQEPVHFGSSGTPHFDIDLVLYDAAKNEALCVLDTKYKAASMPTSDDLAQVVAYAEAKGCSEAILVYPGPPSAPLDTKVGDIRVRSLAFSVNGDLDEQGLAFVQKMIQGSVVSAHG